MRESRDRLTPHRGPDGTQRTDLRRGFAYGIRSLLLSLEVWAIALLAAGALSRVWIAATTGPLHPDEGMHLDTCGYARLLDVLRQVRVAHAHPPLYFVVLHYCMQLTEQLLALRSANIVFITLSAILFYLWLRETFGNHVALTGVALYFVSPGLLFGSIQLRSYSLMLLGITGSLWSFHRALHYSKQRWPKILFALFTFIACCSHYSAAFYVATLSAYSLDLALHARPRRPAFVRWLFANSALCLFYALLYGWHAHHIYPAVQAAAATYLQKGLYQPGSGPLLSYLLHSSLSVFRFFYGRSGCVVLPILILLLAFLCALCRRTDRTRLGSASLLTILLPLPWLISLAAGILGKYPHYGARHSFFLLPFLSCASAIGWAVLLRWAPRLRILTLPITLAYAVWCLPVIREPSITDDQSVDHQLSLYHPQHAAKAEHVLRELYRDGDLIVLSVANNFLFRYYLVRPSAQRWPRYPFDHAGFRRAGDFDTFVMDEWHLMPQSLRGQLPTLLTDRERDDHAVWILSFLGEQGFDRAVPPEEGRSMTDYQYGLVHLVRIWRESNQGGADPRSAAP